MKNPFTKKMVFSMMLCGLLAPFNLMGQVWESQIPTQKSMMKVAESRLQPAPVNVADAVRRQLGELNRKVGVMNAPAYFSELGTSRVMLGGYAINIIGSSGCTLPTANNVFGFDVADLCHQITYPSPFTTAGFDASGTTLSVYCGDWIGDKWLVFTTAKQSGQTYLGYWMTFDPVTYDVSIVGQANGSMQCQDMAYDVTTMKMYGIGLDQEFYRFNTNDTQAKFIGMIRQNGEPFNGRFMALACNSEGILYAVNVDKNLYRIDKNTGGATLVGSLKLDNRAISPDNLQSATFDRRTNVLYFALRGTAFHELYTINTTTGEASLVGNMYAETAGIFHHYYTGKDVPPEMVTNFKTMTGDDPLKIKLSWKNPERNFNGASLTDLDSIYIYRGVSGYSLSIFDRIKASGAGEEMTYEVSEKNTGTYYYGSMAVTKGGKRSLLAGGAVYCFESRIPYQMGFEKEENYMPMSIPAGWRVDTLNAKYHNNGLGAAVTSSTAGSKMLINALKAEKGATYQLELWGLSPSASGARFTVDFGNLLNYNTASITRQTAPFTKFTVTGVADSEVLPVAIKCTTSGVYLDDLSVRMIYPGTTPDSVRSPKVEIAADGKLEAKVTWTNPTLDAGGKTLKALTGLIVQKTSAGGAFTAGVTADTILTTEMGKAMSASIRIPSSGNYYFRLIPINNDGPCPYYYDLGKVGFIGNDTVAMAPANLQVKALEDGKISVKWDRVSTGRYGGYLNGDITGYEVRLTTYDTKVLYNDTIVASGNECITENLPAGIYTVGVKAIRNNNRKNVGLETLAYVTVVGNPDQTLVSGTFAQKPDANTHPFYMAYGSKSAVSQTIFTKEEMGGKCVIDTLSFYLYAPATKEAFKQQLTIYMGYRKENAFENTSDWNTVKDDETQLIFSDSVVVPLNRQIIKIPVKPFYYDGVRNLLLSVVKKDLVAPPNTFTCTFIGLNKDTNRGILKRATTPVEGLEDFSAQLLGTGELVKFTPAVLIGRMLNLASVKGSVTDKESGKPVDNVRIRFVPKEGQHSVLDTYFYNDPVTGKYDFSYLPFGDYSMILSKLGYKESVSDVSVQKGSSYTLDVVMEPSRSITLKGKVVNLKNDALSGVKVMAEGLVGYEATTQHDGTFVIQKILSDNAYKMSFSKDGYQAITVTWNLGANDSTFIPVAIPYVSYPASNIVAETNREYATVKIGKPAIMKEAGWSTDTIAKKVGGSRERMIAAIEFYPSDIQKMELNDKNLMMVKFYANDPTANYVIHLYENEGATLIYSQDVGNSLKGWQSVLLETKYAVDPQKEFSIAVEAMPGYTGAPFALDLGPKTFKGDKVWYDGEWTRISKLITTYDSNWQIRGVFGRELPEDAAGGYQIYRMTDADVTAPDKWIKITGASIPSVNEGYKDYTWGTLEKGSYKYAVKADWMNGNLSEYTLSNNVYKGMDSNVKVQVNTNGGSKNGAFVILTNRDGLASHVYNLTTGSEGIADFPNVWNGQYLLNITLTGHSPVQKNITVNQDMTVAGDVMNEYISIPQIISAVADQDSVRMTWNMKYPANWFDDFESYPDFSIKGFGNYLLDGLEEKYTMTGSAWNNNTKEQSFIVFNPYTTTPPVQSYKYTPYSGKKELAAFVAMASPNKDFIARPVAEGGGVLSLYAKGIGYKGVSEKFDVMYSSSDSKTASFKLVSDSTIWAPAEWGKFSFNIPQDAKYIALRCVSPDLQVFLVDDMEYIAVNEGTPKGYEVYLDGIKKENLTGVEENSFLFKGLSNGTHILGLKAVFETAVSELVTTTVIVNGSGIENTSRDGIYLYPNPSADGIFFVTAPGKYEVEVLSFDGKMIERTRLSNGSVEIDLAAQPKGCYLIKLVNDDETIILKAFK